MTLHRIILIIFLAVAPQFINAAVNIDSLADFIVVRNSGLKAEAKNFEKTILELSAANNLSDPEIGFSHRWGSKGIGNKWDLSISQSFEWPGVYRARRNEAKNTSMALFYDYIGKRNQLLLDVKLQLLEAIRANKIINVYLRVIQRTDSMTEAYARGVKEGQVSVLDLNKLKIVRIGYCRKLSEAETALSTAIGILNSIGGENPIPDFRIESLVEFPHSELLPLETYASSASAHDYNRKYYSGMAQAMASQAETVKASSFPGFSVGFTHEYEMGERFNGLTVGITLPIFSNRKKTAAARQSQAAFEAQSQQIATATNADIEADYAVATRLKSEIGQYRTVLDDSNNMRLLRKAFDSRHITLVDYLQQVNFFLEAEVDYIETEYQYQAALARLNKFVGLLVKGIY